MSLVQSRKIEYFGHKIGKTEILHLVIAAWKFTWRRFPV